MTNIHNDGEIHGKITANTCEKMNILHLLTDC